MNVKTVFFCLLFLFAGWPTIAQESEFITGILLDKNTKSPVAFATIRLKTKALGVVSNQDGSFRIPQRFMRLDEALIISCLGYETKEVSFTELVSNSTNVLQLQPQALVLEETTLIAKRKRPPSPRKIIKRAIERIPINYSLIPFSYTGYYRDYQEQDGTYFNLNESILKVFDFGIAKRDYLTTQAQIIDYKQSSNFKRDPALEIPYDYATQNKVIDNAKLFSFGGNEFFILRIHDAIRNYDVKTFSYVDILEKDLVRNHSLKRKKDMEIGDEKLFVIELESTNKDFLREEYATNKDILDIRAKGTIYISQSNYAIHKMEYKMLDYTSRSKSPDAKNRAQPNLLYEIIIEYQNYGEKMYPNYISVHNAFKVRKSYFKVEDVIFDFTENRFVVKTNNSPIFSVKKGVPNVVLRMGKRKIPIKNMRNSQSGILVYLDKEQINSILEDLGGQNSLPDASIKDLFQFEFSNIMDANGNTLNDFVFEEYYQYREFFTQQLQTDSVTLPTKETFMKKDRPIFQSQSIFKPDSTQEYWMNSPLKSNQ